MKRTSQKITLTAIVVLATTLFSFSQTLNDAIRLTENEQFNKATAAFRQLLQQNPKNGDFYFYFGENYFQNKNLDSARIMYQKGADLVPENPLNYVGLGKIQWYANDAKDAQANFYKALTICKSKNAVVLMKIAEAYTNADTKDLPQAMKLLTQAQALTPYDPNVYLLTGDVYLAQADGSNAVTNYEKATSLDKKSVQGILRLGQLYGRAQNYNLSFDYFKQASAIDSSFAPAYREKAELLAQSGQFDKALQQYQKFLAINNDLSARERYASFLFLSKKYPETVSEINGILQKDTSNVYMYRLIGYSQYETKDYANGLKNMNKFFAKAKNTDIKIISSDYAYEGKLLSQTGQDSLSVLQLKQALKLDSSQGDLYGQLGEIYYRQKKYPECEQAYQKKISLGQANANDYNALGIACYQNKDYVKCDSAFAQITRVIPNWPPAYMWRARANAQLDPDSKGGRAKPFYEQYILKAEPDSLKNKNGLIEAYGYLGYYYALAKDSENAKVYWGKVRDLDPTNIQQKAFFKSLERKK
ncbi:MAG: tetratricopeptide repeat protein [Bacteroidia bacterium]